MSANFVIFFALSLIPINKDSYLRVFTKMGGF